MHALQKAMHKGIIINEGERYEKNIKPISIMYIVHATCCL